MNVYELVFGHLRHYVAAKDEQDAYQQGMDPQKFPDLHFRPFEIIPVTVPGYVVTATPIEQQQATTGDETPQETTRRGGRKKSVA